MVLEGEFTGGRPNGLIQQTVDDEVNFYVYANGDVSEESSQVVFVMLWVMGFVTTARANRAVAAMNVNHS